MNILKTYPLFTTSPYGPRNGKFHGGIDLVGLHPNGYTVLDYICAKDAGVVANVRKDSVGFEDGGSYGNFVHIDHGNGYSTVYAHLAPGSVCVNIGDKVQAGQVIGYMGNTGTSYGGHLHFEVRIWNEKTDPTEYAYGKEFPKPEPTPEPKPASLKYKVGDTVMFTGVLYADSYGNGAGQSRTNLVATITKVNTDAKATKPYNINNGLGWVAESDLSKSTQPVTPELKVGNTVIIVGTGNESSHGNAKTAFGLGWERQILHIWEGRAYPYQVGNSTGTTGYYKASALRRK